MCLALLTGASLLVVVAGGAAFLYRDPQDGPGDGMGRGTATGKTMVLPCVQCGELPAGTTWTSGGGRQVGRQGQAGSWQRARWSVQGRTRTLCLLVWVRGVLTPELLMRSEGVKQGLS